MKGDVALSKLMEIFPKKKNLFLVADECCALLDNQIDLDQAITTICKIDEGKISNEFWRTYEKKYYEAKY